MSKVFAYRTEVERNRGRDEGCWLDTVRCEPLGEGHG